MKSTISQKERKFILEWVLATTIGFVLGEVFLTRLTFSAIPTNSAQNNIDMLLIMLNMTSGITTGILVGIFQWLILRNRLPHILWWISVTPLGMAIGGLIRILFIAESRYLLMDIWPVAIWLSRFFYGAAIGLSQWFVLRQSLLKTWLWVITNGFGWALAITIGEDFIRRIFYPLAGVYYLRSPYSEVAIYGTVGILVGIITGLLLLWLLRKKDLIQKSAQQSV